MSDLHDLATAANEIANPVTSAADLAVIAQMHPSLRTAVAFHPNVYPGLLDWLDGLGDPNLSRAVAARRQSDAQSIPTPVPTQVPTAYPTAVAASMPTVAAAPVPTPVAASMPTVVAAPYPTPVPGYETAFGSTNSAGALDAYAPRRTSGAAIAAGIVFFAGAGLAAWPRLSGQTRQLLAFCGGRGNGLGFYPWGWQAGFSYNCLSYRDYIPAFCIASVVALLACGVVSIAVGWKKVRLAAFIVGIILSCMTLAPTIVAFKDIFATNYFMYSQGLQWFTVFLFLLFLAVPVLLIPLGKSSSGKTVQLLTAFMIIAMGMVFMGIWFFPPSYGYRYGSDLYSGFVILAVNMSDIPLFTAVVLLAFAVPRPPSRGIGVTRNAMLVSGSSMVIAGGAVLLLFFLATGQISLYIQYRPVFGILVVVACVYMVVVGILGLASLTARSRSGLLIGLGAGLVLAQAIWLFIGTVSPSHIITTALLVAMAVLYIVGAVSLRKDPAKRATIQPGGQTW